MVLTPMWDRGGMKLAAPPGSDERKCGRENVEGTVEERRFSAA